ncbi:MAG: hypothetical protein LBT15_06010 [Synergistaceae bacterium]|nr:hypothetical protein [Synergistaceae bacterium]
MSENRVFQCAECRHTFEQNGERLSLRCPECRGKTLVLLEGPSLKGGRGCGGNCGSCSCGCSH